MPVRQVTFSSGTVVTSAFLNRIQEIQAPLAWNLSLSISSNVLTLGASTTTDACTISIGGHYRYATTSKTITFTSPGYADGTYSIYATTDADDNNTAFNIEARTSGTPSTTYYRKIGEVTWTNPNLSNLKTTTSVSRHGHNHVTGGQDPLPAGAVSATELASNSVTTAKIADSAVTAAKLAGDTITESKLAPAAIQSIMPPGTILPYGGATEPDGWLFCRGQAIDRDDYAVLFNVIGTAFGSGNNVDTFNLPDMRGRVPLGRDNMGGSSANRVTAATADIVGFSGGSEFHALTAAEMPAHNHGAGSLVTSVAGAHTHTLQGQSGSTAGGNTTVRMVGDLVDTNNSTSVQAAGDHTHSITGTTQTTGTGTPHNNMSPYITVNYIIKSYY